MRPVRDLFIALAALLALGLSGCSLGRGSQALYIYMCGSTLESKAGAGSRNIDELLAAEVPASTDVVIQTGGSRAWRGHDIPADSLNRYVVEGGELRLVESLPQASMGSAETLEDFLAWCEREYPAETEALVLWDHGGGSTTSICYDENFAMDPLEPAELAAAFEGAGTTYDLIGLDACLMASLDAAALFQPYADYLVASEDIEPSGGWDYGSLVESLGDGAGTLATARGIADAYLEKSAAKGKDAFATLSVMDLSKLGRAQAAFEAFAQDLASAAGDPDAALPVAQAVTRATAFGANSRSEGYSNMIDLHGLASWLHELSGLASAGELAQALEELVVASEAGSARQDAGGVSVYYPLHLDEADLVRYLDATPSERYADYLGAVFGQVPDETVTFADAGSVAEDGSFRIRLAPESRRYLRSVDFYLLELSGEDPARPTYVAQLGSDNDVDYDWETLTFDSNFRGVWPALDGVLLNSTLIGRSGRDLLFTAPVLVNGEHTNLRFSLVFDTDDGGEVTGSHYEVLGLWDGLDEYALAAKQMRALEPGDEVVVLTRVPDGASADSRLVQGEAVTIGEDGATIAEAPLAGKHYQYVYVVRDIYGNVFTSEPALFEMMVSPEDLMSEDVAVDRAYAADVVSVGGEPVARDGAALRDDD